MNPPFSVAPIDESMKSNSNISNSEGLVSLEVAAQWLGVTGTTVRRLILRGDLAGVRVSPGRLLVEQAEIRAYIERRRVRGAVK